MPTPGWAVIECHMPVGFVDPFCRSCGAQRSSAREVVRRLAHVPTGVGWWPSDLVLRVRRFARRRCPRVWRQET